MTRQVGRPCGIYGGVCVGAGVGVGVGAGAGVGIGVETIKGYHW